jgi:hypothetical protein
MGTGVHKSSYFRFLGGTVWSQDGDGGLGGQWFSLHTSAQSQVQPHSPFVNEARLAGSQANHDTLAVASGRVG